MGCPFYQTPKALIRPLKNTTSSKTHQTPSRPRGKLLGRTGFYTDIFSRCLKMILRFKTGFSRAKVWHFPRVDPRQGPNPQNAKNANLSNTHQTHPLGTKRGVVGKDRLLHRDSPSRSLKMVLGPTFRGLKLGILPRKEVALNNVGP
jgi:hypothetical protein